MILRRLSQLIKPKASVTAFDSYMPKSNTANIAKMKNALVGTGVVTGYTSISLFASKNLCEAKCSERTIEELNNIKSPLQGPFS